MIEESLGCGSRLGEFVVAKQVALTPKFDNYTDFLVVNTCKASMLAL